MRFDRMKRRQFIAAVGGAAAWSLAAGAQESQRIRRIGMLSAAPETEEMTGNMTAFRRVLEELGWIHGRNVRLDLRWSGGNATLLRQHIADFITLRPDVIFASGTAAVGPLLQASRSIPIVFANVADPVGAGFVESLARPGGNVTGFIQFDYSLSGKWLELLKQIAPNITRMAVLRDPEITAGIGQFAVIQSVAPSLGVEVRAINGSDPGEIARTIAAFAQTPNGGLIVTASARAVLHRELIITLAARHQLPAIYYRRYFADRGGLMSYGYNVVEQFVGAARYADRILRGEKAADLPVQAPTRYELVLNLQTAKALGIEVPPMLLARADEVID
jgi:putative ABC transport system substrate-binding protein